MTYALYEVVMFFEFFESILTKCIQVLQSNKKLLNLIKLTITNKLD